MAVSTFLKRDFVQLALEEIGLATYVFDGTAEEDVAALRRLDTMMSSVPWTALAYLQPVTAGASLPSDAAGIDDLYVEAVYTNLAARIAPTYGKAVSVETRAAASQGRIAVASLYATAAIGARELNSNVVRGQGNRRRYDRDPFFFISPEAAALNALGLNGDTISLSQ